jgi:hypothetical protein
MGRRTGSDKSQPFRSLAEVVGLFAAIACTASSEVRYPSRCSSRALDFATLLCCPPGSAICSAISIRPAA